MTFNSVMKALWLLLAIYGTTIVADYVDQQRGTVMGMCPAFATPNGAPGLLIFDTRTGAAFCTPLPLANKSELPATPPNGNQKQGV
jgi:hypothetical protein